MGKQILVSPEVLRKSAQGLAAAKEELMYLIEALEQVQTALPGCWESPNTQRYMEKLERVLQSAAKLQQSGRHSQGAETHGRRCRGR